MDNETLILKHASTETSSITTATSLVFDSFYEDCATKYFHTCLKDFSDTIFDFLDALDFATPSVDEMENEKWIISTTAPQARNQNEIVFILRFGCSEDKSNPPLNIDRYNHAFFFGVSVNLTPNPCKFGFKISNYRTPNWNNCSTGSTEDYEKEKLEKTLHAVMVHMRNKIRPVSFAFGAKRIIEQN